MFSEINVGAFITRDSGYIIEVLFIVWKPWAPLDQPTWLSWPCTLWVHFFYGVISIYLCISYENSSLTGEAGRLSHDTYIMYMYLRVVNC